ncbi:MAG: helix-turn-helix domain-containing protein [Saprospiraceae bacterium]|nr:helix-turn-helix domain-containing protein [Saprospiraceae bacterium]MBK6665673.1 helix-turn-helix domain-containing protein [Saprospiraceae bacterium]MBK8828940.1 helix-turn-helix domain-containing protein [Saprospiraceae bacterium]MBK9582412.1 helix-turn-helix domain-containing protein [Saprospiraceae bacterium]
MSKTTENNVFLSSKEAKKMLKVSDCHLAHMRMEGKLPFVKKGNAYMYETIGLELTKLKLQKEHA